ncbi:MAG: hypothetical protein CBARDCOR_6340 [uncultured Caballeronia sp.]|nr:MAG: hypothetical protein CBARDCOR_6340 [uncultured Caballeronia sp.]
MSEPQEKEGPADSWLIDWCERGRLPDSLVRLGMRRLIKQRLRDEGSTTAKRARSASTVWSMNCGQA